MLEQQKETHKGLREAGFSLVTNKALFSLFYGGYGGMWVDTLGATRIHYHRIL
jgi:hypothetical protein